MERLRLEAQNRETERANRRKSEFLASISHELRSPLRTIIGFTQLLVEELEGPLNERQKRFLTHIGSDSSHLLQLVNEILDLSKIEAGKLDLHLERFDAIEATSEVVNSIAPLASAKSIRVEQAVGTGFSLRADRLRLKQILLNLLSNAVKFTPECGTVSITSSTAQSSATSASAIRDQGFRPMIYRPFSTSSIKCAQA